ncbi:hypothetical protein EF888_03430 [Silicimonas algicola]|uniref:Chemotaxis protein MotC n=1 Tax=Silicimonas algicola TaxID=1826607 RepID=A0A316GCI6_9RHOB|nr:hypothetical protein [Silicimonas algicola]AZQ66266.1 hypothetical protein EF888_03430 [Silicimonas algicola]PWK58584.1 hypothetical protein C8D95_101398 [Silicimonas algicola]
MATDGRNVGRGAVLAVAALLAGTVVQAAEDAPLSAIDWLSDSIDLPETVAAPAEEAPASLPPAIAVAPIEAAGPDRAGLVDARTLGLAPDIWGRSSAADLARAISALPDGASGPPSLRRFLHDLMVVRLDPPVDAMVDDSLYLARIDRLLGVGHLDAADALIREAGAPEPKRFRRAFDIALLKGTETNACLDIDETPDISPTYMARIFCLARLGKWDVAALTLGNAQALGILSDDEDALMRHFLDPELFEGEPIPPAPTLPTPLQFRIYEAVGERIPTDRLPVAFTAADLTDTVGWQARVRAAERLAAVDAMSVATLLGVFSERKAAASGGVWDRVAKLHAADEAIRSQDVDAVTETLPDAFEAAAEGGYAPGFAAWAAPRLSSLDLKGPAAHVAFEIALLAASPDIAARFATQSREDKFLLDLATGQGGTPPGFAPLDRAALRGLSALGPGEAYKALVEDSRAGEALLRAVSQLMDGAAGNPDLTAQSLALLRHLGLEALARQVAVELVLMEGAA